MRIENTDRRERNWVNLKEATGEGTVSGALDAATVYYLRMAGSKGHPTSAVEKLRIEAEKRGSLTIEELAEILNKLELLVKYEARWRI